MKPTSTRATVTAGTAAVLIGAFSISVPAAHAV